MSTKSGERNRVLEGVAHLATIAIAGLFAAVLMVVGIAATASGDDSGSRSDWERAPSSSERVLEVPRVYKPDNSAVYEPDNSASQPENSGSAPDSEVPQAGNADDSASTGNGSAGSPADNSPAPAADDSAANQAAPSTSDGTGSPDSKLGSVDDYETQQAESVASGAPMMVMVPLRPVAGEPNCPPPMFGVSPMSMSPAYVPLTPMIVPAGPAVIPLSKPLPMPAPRPMIAPRPVIAPRPMTTMRPTNIFSAGRGGFRVR